MQSNLPAGKPSFGIGYDTTIGWYAWFGHSAQSGVRVPFKMIAKPVKAAGNTSKIAGRAMATNPLFWGAIGVGATVGWIYERRARTKADKARKEAEIAHAFESGRADVAEKDRDEAAAKAEEMKKQIDLGYAAVITPSPDEISRIRSAYGINGNDRNIAVCGRVSAGKSAFVNSVRGLLASHPDAAPIDNEETTTEIRGYRDPHLPTIVWWDVPGTGGRTSRDWDYFAEQVLFVFDQIIIVHEQIFSLTELGIYGQCLEYGKEALIVRTQSDNNMRRITDDDSDWEPIDLVSHYVVESTRATTELLQKHDLPVPRQLFHVTSKVLRWERDRSFPATTDPFLQRIDERLLLIELGIH